MLYACAARVGLGRLLGRMCPCVRPPPVVLPPPSARHMSLDAPDTVEDIRLVRAYTSTTMRPDLTQDVTELVRALAPAAWASAVDLHVAHLVVVWEAGGLTFRTVYGGRGLMMGGELVDGPSAPAPRPPPPLSPVLAATLVTKPSLDVTAALREWMGPAGDQTPPVSLVWADLHARALAAGRDGLPSVVRVRWLRRGVGRVEEAELRAGSPDLFSARLVEVPRTPR